MKPNVCDMISFLCYISQITCASSHYRDIKLMVTYLIYQLVYHLANIKRGSWTRTSLTLGFTGLLCWGPFQYPGRLVKTFHNHIALKFHMLLGTMLQKCLLKNKTIGLFRLCKTLIETYTWWNLEDNMSLAAIKTAIGRRSPCYFVTIFILWYFRCCAYFITDCCHCEDCWCII